jgi:hypothetical protein
MGTATTGAALSHGIKSKRPHKYLCGVPSDKCTGGMTGVSNGLKKAGKTHGSPAEAHKCYSKWLLSQGYTQVGPREYSKNGGPILLLTKKSKFGARLRGGKADRQMPSVTPGGLIISC